MAWSLQIRGAPNASWKPATHLCTIFHRKMCSSTGFSHPLHAQRFANGKGRLPTTRLAWETKVQPTRHGSTGSLLIPTRRLSAMWPFIPAKWVRALWMVNEYRPRRVTFTGGGLRAKLLVPLKADRGRLAGKPTMTYLIAYIWSLWYYKPENF